MNSHEQPLRPALPSLDGEAAHLFEICMRMGGCFTMQGIVARVLREQPQMVLHFAELWSRLLSHRLVRVHQSGETSTYEVTAAHGV